MTTTASTIASPSPRFDPLLAFLDEQWPLLSLSATPSPPPASPPCPAPAPPPAPAEPAPLAGLRLDFADAERQLRSALRDADDLDALRARCQADLAHSRRQLDLARRRARVADTARARSEGRNAALRECVATMGAAHQLDARINALVIADQQDEIRHLRDALRDALRAGKGEEREEERERELEGSTASDDSGEDAAFGRVGAEVTVCLARGEGRAERDRLARSKTRLLESFERRHSESVESIVRRNSQACVGRGDGREVLGKLPSE